jgi:cytochrome c-type biogenesis protein
MGDSLALAGTAGMLAAVNPCGFALLPAYLTLLVLDDDSPAPARALLRALALTGAMTLGFVAVFGVFGLVLSPVAAQLTAYLPWFTVFLGVAVVLAGVWLLIGRELPALRWHARGGARSRSVPAMVGFGASYAAASLTCTIGPFLAVVVASFRAGSTGEGLLLYVAYALGMGAVVGAAAIAVALVRRGLVSGLRRAGRWLPYAAGVLLVVVGSYVAWYGAWELRVLGGDDPADPVIEAASRIQRFLARALDAITP